MKAKRLVFLALCMVIALTSSILPTALTIKASDSTESVSKYDYSNPDSTFNVTATAADVLEKLGYDVSDAERAYLDAYCDFEVNYDLVLNDKISKIASVEDGVSAIVVTADPHTYTAKNGDTVTWIPYTASITDGNGAVIASETVSYNGTEYSTKFVGVENNDDYTFAVQYKVEFEIDAEDVNYVLNFAYNTKGPLEYYYANEESVLTYYAYLADKQRWDDQKAAFDAYPGLYAEYQAKLAAYNKYESDLATYLDIKNKLDNYNAELEVYNNYLAELEDAMEHMEALNTGLFNKVSYLDRELYACLFSPLVDEVVARKDELVAVKPKLESHINNAKTASVAIQQVFRPDDGTKFEDLKTDKEKYAFYLTNYDAICDNLLLLGESLYYIYTTSGIRLLMHEASATLNRPEYTEKLAIFIAQIFCLHDALVDTDSPNKYTHANGSKLATSEMTFSYWTSETGVEKKNVSIAALFEEVYVEDKNNAKPTPPPTEVSKPTEPAVKELPPMPEEVKEPVAPEIVTDPGIAPAVVNEPDGLPEFDWQKFINDPAYQLTLSNLYNTIKDVTEGRAEVSSPETLTLTTTVKAPFDADACVEVIFNDANGEEIWRASSVKMGSSLTYGGKTPTKAADTGATYRFDGWVTAEGEPYSLHSVTENITLYPKFTTVTRDYTVNAGNLVIDATDIDISEISIEYFGVLMNTQNASKLTINTNNAAVILKNDTVSRLRTANVAYVDVDLVAMSEYRYTYTVYAYDASGARVDVDETVEMHLPCMRSNLTVNCTDTDGTAVSAHSNSGLNYFNAKVGKSYSIVAGYRITCTYGNTLSMPKIAVPGETVEFTVNLIEGMKADINYVLNGVKYPVTGNSFVMPAGDISIDATFSDIIYTVRFESDGKVIFEKYYKYGDVIEKPNTPTKINDDKYSYRFSHWSPAVSDTVTGDVTYVAVFKRTPLPVEADKVNWLRVAVVMAIVMFSLGVALIILLILNKKKVINIKGFFRAIFKRNSEENSTDSVEDAIVPESSESAEAVEVDTDGTEVENVSEATENAESDTDTSYAENTQENAENAEFNTDTGVNSEENAAKDDTAEE